MALPVNPPAAPAASGVANGNLSAGAYLWAVTFIGNYGETGLGGAAGFTATLGQAGSLTSVPVGPAGTTGRNIYRTKVGGTTFFYAGTILDNVTTTFTDLVADGGLGGAPTQFFVAQGEVQGTFVMFDDQRPPATSQYGDLNIGPGPWDGATAGFFAGSANGTGLAMGMVTGFAGNLADWQVNGASKFSMDATGKPNFVLTTTTTAPGAGGAGALPATPAGYATVSINGTNRQIAYY